MPGRFLRVFSASLFLLVAGTIIAAAGGAPARSSLQGPIVFTSDPNLLIPPSCPQFPAFNLPGVLCETFDTDRNGVAGFQWSRLPIGADPNDPLRALGDPNDDVLGYTMHGGPSPQGTAGVICQDDVGTFVGCQGPLAEENDWHLHSPFEGPGAGYAHTSPYPFRPDVGQTDGGKAHSGVRSMHMGRHLNATTTLQDTLSLRQVSAFVLDSQGDPAVAGIIPGPYTTLEFWQMISVPDDENFGSGFVPSGTSFGGGQVQISLMGDDGRFERWRRLDPTLNGYDSTIQELVSVCGFDPGDDLIPPANETMCDHSPLWADLGDVFGTDTTCTTDTDDNDTLHKDCGAISGCTPGPGCTENGSIGTGVWARSAFDLSQYGGRVARLRWIGMVEGGWSFGMDRSALEVDSGVAYQYYDGDDGWWIDDIVLTGLQRSPGPCTATDDDGDGFTECQRDCDDANPAVYPGAPQVCGDGVNNDCNDARWPLGDSDADLDADGMSPCQGDCDDGRSTVYAGAPEICDGYNNDCNSPGWPAPLPGDADADADGVFTCAGDCDDGNPRIYPGAPQICDGYNNDCSSPIWPALSEEEIDGDGDGWSACNDCDDNDPSAYPGAPELCDGIRNNCSAPWFQLGEIDNDGDGLSECQQDCNDASGTSWAPPGPVTLTLSFDRGTGVTTFAWDPPAPAGGTLVLYDLLESWQPNDFWSSECLESDDPWDTRFDQPASLPWPDLRFYLVRAQNGCPGTVTGSIGANSAGTQRTGRDCRP